MKCFVKFSQMALLYFCLTQMGLTARAENQNESNSDTAAYAEVSGEYFHKWNQFKYIVEYVPENTAAQIKSKNKKIKAYIQYGNENINNQCTWLQSQKIWKLNCQSMIIANLVGTLRSKLNLYSKLNDDNDFNRLRIEISSADQFVQSIQSSLPIFLTR